jgi:flagellar hook assembly protein FlgD
MNRNLVVLAGAALAAAAALLGCQSVKPETPAPSAIQVEEKGFAPQGSDAHTAMVLELLFGNGTSITSWTASVETDGTAVRSWKGTAAYLPASLQWDGNDDAGKQAPEGTYSATLSIHYKGLPSVTEQSTKFVLDRTPPTGTVTLDPSEFVPTGTSVTGTVTLRIDAASNVATIESWKIDVLDIAGGLVKSFSGRWPDAVVTWDGSSLEGGFVRPSMSYRAVATVRDEFGLSGKLTATVPVAALPTAGGQAVAQAPASVPTAPTAVPGVVSVTPGSAGFSPRAESAPTTIRLSLGYGQPASVTGWSLTINAAGAAVVRSFSGGAKDLPTTVSWDGIADQGGLAADGSYTAKLSVQYSGTYPDAAVTSAPFLLVSTPPTGSISLSSSLFSPIEGPATVTLTIAARGASGAAIDSWSMDIDDPTGNAFRGFSGKWPTNSVTWDGKGAGGDFVQSAEDYPVSVTVRDQFGNTAALKSIVPVDILVEKTARGYQIPASRIFFQAFTADYVDVAADLSRQNAGRLDALAKKLAKFPGYRIRIVGHAVMIHWDDPALGKAEQDAILLPLSKARADAVRDALVKRGLDAARFTTDGVGASDQLVPDSDFVNRWQNRRVALFLEKP